MDCSISVEYTVSPNLNSREIVTELLNRYIHKKTISFSIDTPLICGKTSREILLDSPVSLYNKPVVVLQTLLGLYNLQLLGLFPENQIYTGFRRKKSYGKTTVVTIHNVGFYYDGTFEMVIDISKTKLERTKIERLYYVSDFSFQNKDLEMLLEPYKDDTVVNALVIHGVKHNFINFNVNNCTIGCSDILLYNPTSILYILYEDNDNVVSPGIILDTYLDSIILYNLDKKTYDTISLVDIKRVPINFSGLPNQCQVIKLT